MHVKIDEIVDIAEGTRSEASAPHLANCEACRARLHELRAMRSAAQDVDVPEPSPLFWDHLSSRVREAVAAEAVPRRSWLTVALWRRGVMDPLLAVAVAGLLIAVVLSSRATAPAPIAALPVAAVADAVPELLNDVAADVDASLALVASFTDEVDLETAHEAGLAPHGSAEHAITHMSESELRELRRLLREELARSGA